MLPGLLERAEALLADRLGRVSLKSINEVLRDYRDQLMVLVTDAVNGNIKTAAFRTKHNTLIETLGQQAYIEGMREGGLKDAEDELSDEDSARIEDWIFGQLEFVLGFAQDAVEAGTLTGDERTSARDSLFDRIDTWVSSLKNLANLGYVSAQGDPMLTFDGDDGNESCNDCQKYKGQRHRRSWWERRGLLARNGNVEFECGRWDDHCTHHYYFDDGSLAID